MITRTFLTAAALAYGSALCAQAVVTGTVVDEIGEPTIGASVVVVGSDPINGTATDFDGKYQITVEDPPGTIDLRVSYTGYADQVLTDVVVTDGETTYQDVLLEENAEELEEVVVVARRTTGTAAAIDAIRLGSDRVLDGISSQEMSRLALSDAAGALSKTTGTTIVDGRFIVVRGLGDRYSTAQLNGLQMPSTDPYRNSPQLDLIPASLLDNIVTSKTFTPDQPGSFTGGNVNLQTKAFPDQRLFSVSASVGYNTQSTFNDDFLTHRGGGNDYFGYDDGTRALPGGLVDIGDNPFVYEDRFGRERSVSILSPGVQTFNATNEEFAPLFDQIERAADLLPTDFTTTASAPTVNHGLSLTYGDRLDLGGDKQLGFVLNGRFDRDYQHYTGGTEALYVLDDPEATALNPFFLYDRDTRSIENPSVGLFGSASLRVAQGQTVRATMVYSHNTQIETRLLRGVAPGYNVDEPDFVDNSVQNFLERSSLTGQLAGQHALMANGDLRLEWAGAVTQSTQNTPNLRFLSTVVDVAADGTETPIFRQNEFGLPANFFRELNDLQYEGKLDLMYDFPTGGHKLKFGGAYQTKTRDFGERIFESFQVPRSSLRNISAGPEAFFADDNTGVVTLDNGNVRVNNFVNDITLASNSYDGEETIAAAYGMGTVRFGERFRVIAGARLEHTDIFVESRDTTLGDSTRIGAIDQLNVLPSVSVVFRPTDRSNIRVSFTQTLARPNMREVAIFPSFEFSGGPRFSGNPDLVLTQVNNYDLRWELSPEDGGIFSASAFYKTFNDPIVVTYLTGLVSPFFTYVNVEEATVYGLELEARRDLGFLAPGLSGLSVGVNASLIESSSKIDQEEIERNNLDRDTRPLQGQSPYIVNANVAYADDELGIDASVAFNYFGDRLSFIGNRGTPDVFERGRGSLDATLSKAVGPVDLRLTASNLLDPRYQTYADYLGTDFVFSEFRRGRTFQFGVGYTFGG